MAVPGEVGHLVAAREADWDSGARFSAYEVFTEEAELKRPFQPHKRRRAKRHGFRHRMATRSGRAVLKARRLKGRHRLAA